MAITQDSQGLGVFAETRCREPGGRRPGFPGVSLKGSSEPARPAQTLQTSGWARVVTQLAPQAAWSRVWGGEN